MRQLDGLRQSGSVSELLVRFEELSHAVLLYNPTYDDTFFVTRFLGGLVEEICSAIALHRPKNVQEASTLALLQEAELDNRRKKYVPTLPKPSFRTFSSTEKQKQMGVDKPDKVTAGKQPFDKPEYDDKVKALMVFRKKNGLCYKCGEKWGHGHKCPPQVSLHVIEELFDAMEFQSSSDSDVSDAEQEEQDVVMAVGVPAHLQAPKRKTMKIQGVVANQ